MELLQNISGTLEAESLTSLHLTCKTLEAVTFDQFTEHYCTERECFILSAVSWAKLQIQFRQSPSLISKIKFLRLATDIYGASSFSTLQLVPEQTARNLEDAQHRACENVTSDEVLSSWPRRSAVFCTRIQTVGVGKDARTSTGQHATQQFAYALPGLQRSHSAAPTSNKKGFFHFCRRIIRILELHSMELCHLLPGKYSSSLFSSTFLTEPYDITTFAMTEYTKISILATEMDQETRMGQLGDRMNGLGARESLGSKSKS
jgi:hypothetical protein